MDRSTISLVVLGTLFFYILSYLVFYRGLAAPEYPVLRARLGTVLWHSSNLSSGQGEVHAYCYYPKAGAIYNRSGEYLLKRVNSYSDCYDWLGVAIFQEGSWVSEREKIWWSAPQQLGS